MKRRPRRLPALLFVFAAAVLSGPRAAAQEPDLEALESRASEAALSGDYGGAARILREARTAWPEEPRIPLLLGDLYTERELHSLAMDEFLAADALSPENTEILQRIADGYGFLNREEDSIGYLRRILDKDPGDIRAVGDLGWMLFKTHKLKEGVALLEDAEKRIKKDIGFSMTLGTLRAELFDYEESKRRYYEAIAGSRAEGYSRFASVAYYNLALLESRFRFWDAALDAADMSILTEARSSGYLARGELRLKRMELRAAMEDFRSAYGLDTTPLARLSLAEASLVAGRLDEALVWVREVAKLEDHPWMASFGTDPESFSMDIHELCWEIYAARAEREKIRPKSGLKDAVSSLAKRGMDILRAAYHERLFRKSARAVAGAYEKEGAAFPAAAHGAIAFHNYPRLARKYLEEARKLETAHIPGSGTAYDLEEAALRRDAGALSSALERLDAAWERDLTEEGLGELAGILVRSGRRGEARAVLERLWLLNPGALPQRGFSVPALVSLETSRDVAGGFSRDLLSRLSRLGMALSGGQDDAFAFLLELNVEGGRVDYRLLLRSSGATLRKGFLDFGNAEPSAKELAAFLFDRLNETNL